MGSRPTLGLRLRRGRDTPPSTRVTGARGLPNSALVLRPGRSASVRPHMTGPSLRVTFHREGEGGDEQQRAGCVVTQSLEDAVPGDRPRRAIRAPVCRAPTELIPELDQPALHAVRPTKRRSRPAGLTVGRLSWKRSVPA
jgi:hypothetical protein